MIRNAPGVRPKHVCSAIYRNRGFSMVEVMMTVVLLAISMALAVPSYRDMVEKRQVTNGAEQLATFINTAQGVSMKTNQVVTVSWTHTDEDEWCIGAIEGEAACDCTVGPGEVGYCEIDSQTFVLNNSHTGDLELMHAMTGDGSYAFDPVRGIFTDLSDSLTLELRSPSQDFRLNLLVNNTGRVLLCSEDSSHAIPGYEICPETGGVVIDPEEPPVIGIGF